MCEEKEKGEGGTQEDAGATRTDGVAVRFQRGTESTLFTRRYGWDRVGVDESSSCPHPL